MGYGARARRSPATGGSVLTDVDIYKILLLCKTERGFSGTVMNEIYSMSDFYKKCGGFNSSYYGSYVAQSFYDELENDISCEMKVLSYVDTSAVQATLELLDSATVPTKIFDVKAAYKNEDDESAFGNKIGLKVSNTNLITMKLTASLVDGATEAYLDSVDNLKVGYYVKFVDGVKEEVRAITEINQSTKKITFAAISEATGFDYATATVYRLDWKIEVYVKDELGNFQKEETWDGPFAKSDTIGLADDVNDIVSGSSFIKLAVNSANTDDPEDQIPVALTVETPLTGGSDGDAPTDSSWDTLADTYLADEEFTFLIAPESSSITHAQNMVNFCTDGYKGMAYVHASNGATEDTLKNFGASCRGSIKFGMVPSDKWITVNDPVILGGYKEIPKTGIDAAHWFNTYSRYGESKVAAGNKSEMVLKANGKLLDSNGLVHDDPSGAGGRLIRNYSVNICRYRRGIGITNNSARTLSTDNGYKYQNQIMQWVLYARSIVSYLKQIEQDRAGSLAQESHYNSVYAYMKGKYNAGHLFIGQKEDGSSTTFKDVCIIVNDFTINTLANINNGIEEIFVQAVFPVPIEEPILSLASAGVTSISA